MQTPEAAVNDAVVNPLSRLMILLFGTWLIGSLHPIPETIFYLDSFGSHTPKWFEFQFLPIFGAFAGNTVLVSGPIAIFCIVCSAFDRWSWKKTTTLSGISTFSMLMLEDWDFGAHWTVLTLMQLLIVGGVVLICRPLREV